jgi:predicted transcriptional regulator
MSIPNLFVGESRKTLCAELYLRGYPQHKIAEMLGVSEGMVSKYLIEL